MLAFAIIARPSASPDRDPRIGFSNTLSEPNPKRVERSQQVGIPSVCKTGWSRRCLGLKPLDGNMTGEAAAIQAI
jgi:hypothetical protein